MTRGRLSREQAARPRTCLEPLAGRAPAGRPAPSGTLPGPRGGGPCRESPAATLSVRRPGTGRPAPQRWPRGSHTRHTSTRRPPQGPPPPRPSRGHPRAARQRSPLRRRLALLAAARALPHLQLPLRTPIRPASLPAACGQPPLCG